MLTICCNFQFLDIKEHAPNLYKVYYNFHLKFLLCCNFFELLYSQMISITCCEDHLGFVPGHSTRYSELVILLFSINLKS